MPVVGAALKPEWMKPTILKHPNTGEETNVYKLALNLADDTMLLGGKEYVGIEHSSDLTNEANTLRRFKIKLMHESSLSDGWHDDTFDRSACWGQSLPDLLPLIGTLHHGLIALLYDYPISIKAFCLSDEVHGSYRCDRYRNGSLAKSLPFFCAVLALADYYGSMRFIGVKFIDLLAAHRDLWKEVSLAPTAWLRVAKKLEWKELFLNCARLILSGGDLDLHVREFGMTVEEAERGYDAFQAQHERMVRKLQKDLLRLQLTEHHYLYNSQDCRAFTTFLHALRFRSNRSAVAKANERADYLAKSIYGEWLTNHLAGGETLYSALYSRMTRSDTAPGFVRACDLLLEAAKTPDPSKIFGAKVPERISSIFKLNRRFDAVGRVRYILNELVREAAQIIEKTFEAPEEVDEDGSMLTYRRAMWDSGVQSFFSFGTTDTFSYMPLDESVLPWNE